MPDVDQAFLTQQTEMLREIRDELRSSRAQAGAIASGSGGGASTGGARAGSTFSQFQAAADRTLLGEWNTLGWSNAYKGVYSSSYTGDLMAVMGVNRAPSNMTQQEYEATAKQSLGIRTANIFGNLIAPEYTNFSNELTGTIYRNSQRFIRAGSPLSNSFGGGFNLSTSAQLGATVGHLAMNDARLSIQDYAQIVDTGMRTNQFNDVGSSDEFVKRTKELAEATASLTRTMHMSVGEITQVMGNLRTMGIQGIGQQQSMVRHIGAMAGVAGMTNGEMLQFSGQFAEGMMGSGVNAAASMQLAASNAAMVRMASSQGLISGNAVAQGGGALQIASNLSRAQLNFASSMPGYLALQGGGGLSGANSYSAMFAGIGKYRTGADMLSMGLDRMEAMDNLGAGESETLFRNHIFSGLKMMGMDTDSRAAKGLVFNQLQQQYGMDAATARTWIATNQSVNGRRAMDVLGIQAAGQDLAMQRRDQEDQYYARHSFAGRISGGFRQAEAFGASLLDAVHIGIGGYGGQSIDDQLKHLGTNAPAGSSGMTMSERLDAIIASKQQADLTIDGPSTRSMNDRSSDRWAAGTFMGMSAAGTISGLAAGAGWSMGALGIAGAAAVSAVAMPALAVAGVGLAAYGLYSMFGSNESEHFLSGRDSRNLDSVLQANRRADGKRGIELLRKIRAAGGLKGDAWSQLRGMDNDASDGADTLRMAELARQVVSENKDLGIGSQQVMDMVTAASGVHSMSDAFEVGGSKVRGSNITTNARDAMHELTGENFWSRNKKVSGLNITATSGQISKFVQSVLDSPDGKGGDLEEAELRKMAGPSADALIANVHRMAGSESGRSQLKDAAGGFESVNKAVSDEMLRTDEEAAKTFMVSRFNDAGASLSKEDKSLVDKTFNEMKQGSVFSSLESGRVKELVEKGAFGEAAKQVIHVASGAELVKMSAKDITKRYGLSVKADEWAHLIEQDKSGGSIREMIQSTMLKTGSAQSEKAGGETETKLLQQTARILDGIEARVRSKAPDNAAK